MTELTAAFRTVGSSETVRNDRVVPYYLDDRKLRIAISACRRPPLRVRRPVHLCPIDRKGTMLTLGRPPRRHDDHVPMPRLPVRHHDRSRARRAGDRGAHHVRGARSRRPRPGPDVTGRGRRDGVARGTVPTGGRRERKLHPPRPDQRCDARQRRLRGLPSHRRSMGPPADVHDVRACGLLQQLPEPSRDRPLPRHRPSDRPVLRAGRGLVVLLHRRHRVHGRRVHLVRSPLRPGCSRNHRSSIIRR